MSAHPSSVARPLIVRIRNFIGDVVLLIPALERLQAAGYELHLVGKPWAKSLLEAYGCRSPSTRTNLLSAVRC